MNGKIVVATVLGLSSGIGLLCNDNDAMVFGMGSFMIGCGVAIIARYVANM